MPQNISLMKYVYSYCFSWEVKLSNTSVCFERKSG